MRFSACIFFSMLTLSACGIKQDGHTDENHVKTPLPAKSVISFSNEAAIIRSLNVVIRSAGGEFQKQQIMLGMERIAADAMNDEMWLQELRRKNGTPPNQPILSTMAIVQLLKEDSGVRTAFTNKTSDDFLSAANSRRGNYVDNHAASRQ